MGSIRMLRMTVGVWLERRSARRPKKIRKNVSQQRQQWRQRKQTTKNRRHRRQKRNLAPTDKRRKEAPSRQRGSPSRDLRAATSDGSAEGKHSRLHELRGVE